METWLSLGIDHKTLLPSEEPCWCRSIWQRMGWDSTLFGHITNVLVLCFWCGMSLQGPTAESLIKRDLPVKYIASHGILIPRWSSLWPINYQEDRSHCTIRGTLLWLEGRPCYYSGCFELKMFDLVRDTTFGLVLFASKMNLNLGFCYIWSTF